MDLKQLFGFFKEPEMDKIKFEEVFLNSVAKDSVNKYDKSVTITEGEVKTLLDKYDFLSLYQRLGFELSKDGKDWALVAYLVDGLPVVDYAKVASFKEVAGRLLDVCLMTGTTTEVSGGSYPVIIRFYINGNGQVIRTNGYINDSGAIINTGKKVTYPNITRIPVKLMFNNALRLPDIAEELRPMIHTAGHFLNSVKPEWEKIKVQYLNNTVFNSEQTAETMQENMVNKGKSFHDVTDPDGKIGNAMAPLSVGTQTVSQLETTFGFMIQNVLKFALQYRDHSGNTTTGNATDIAIFNQQAFEYMTNKMEFRQRQLQDFINMVAEMAGYTPATVTIEVAEFESWRMEILKAQADIQVAQAEQARGIARKNIAEAEAIENGSAQPQDPSAVNTSLNIEGVNTQGK